MAADTPTTTTTQRKRVIFAGAIGSVVEYYDFGVYGYTATTLAVLFFPSSSPTASLLATLAVFAVAFVARPIGSVFFGHIGDRYGRKPALALSVLVMALATFAIGLLPTHASIGIAAPALLVVARLLQGLSAGGEVSGAASFLAEAAPDNRRGFMTSATQVGSVLGLDGVFPSCLVFRPA
jgi:MHS family proline/betaine transporter-like MFS transporter